MATNDRRESAVYMSVEDKSYIGPTTEVGRTVFASILSDRGPHKRIVEVTSKAEYQKLFGIPDIQKCSQTHYMLDKALEYTGKVLVCRVTPDDSYLSNVVIKDTSLDDALIIKGDFSFTSGSSVIECAPELIEQISIGDYVFSETDTEVNSIKVIGLNKSYGVITLESVYAGTGGISNLVKDTKTTISGLFTFLDTTSETLGLDYTGYGEIHCSLEDMDQLTLGSWVYLSTDTITESRQIVSLTEGASAVGIVKLDTPYTGTIGTGNIKTYLPYSSYSEPNIVSVNDIEVEGSFVYYFYANGAGSFYNDLVIKGVRNFELEKMYVDDDGNPFYENVFMDFYVYKNNDNGTQTLMEGPYVVSLTRKTPNNEIIKDFITGTAIYIEDVINSSSQFIRVVSGSQVEALTNPVFGTQKRLQLMTELLKENPIAINNITKGGLNFSEGSNGTGLYDSFGNISPSELMYGRVASSYNGSLTSIDGSIEMMPEQIFPVYSIDYIISGGFPANVQIAAASLASAREDCHHLADTGLAYNSVTSDLYARRTIMPLNNWTTSLYVQYRQIRDVYTGRMIWISPVYHAIQNHLNVDNKYFIAEPVANIEKGAINDEIKLAYQTNHTTRGDLLDKELNFTVVETDGVYFSSQFTTWKRYSALKRQHIAKFTAYVNKQLPKILKDVVQRKATAYWLSQAKFRVENFFTKFIDGVSTDRYACINSFTCVLDFDKTRSELNIYVTFTPILSIERINVSLTIPATL
jgi:hypothetical protein